MYVHSLMCFKDLRETINPYNKPKISKESCKDTESKPCVIILEENLVRLWIKLVQSYQ